MRKLQIEDAGVMRLAIQQEINRNDESRYDHRLHGLLLVAAGQSCRQVGLLFGENPTTVQRWVSRFDESGLEGLREGQRCGRPRLLHSAQWRKLQGELRRIPRALGLEANVWDGPLLAEHLRRHYGLDLGVRQCQRVFRQMGFGLRTPRPQVVQSYPLKVAGGKKLRRLASCPAGVDFWGLDECPLPATRLAPPYVAASADQGSRGAARPDPQVRGLLRRRKLSHRHSRASEGIVTAGRLSTEVIRFFGTLVRIT